MILSLILGTAALPDGITIVGNPPTVFTYRKDIYLEPGKTTDPSTASIGFPVNDLGPILIEVDGRFVFHVPDRNGPPAPDFRPLDYVLSDFQGTRRQAGFSEQGKVKNVYLVAERLNMSTFGSVEPGPEPRYGRWTEWSVLLSLYDRPYAYRGTMKVTAPAAGFLWGGDYYHNVTRDSSRTLRLTQKLLKPGLWQFRTNFFFTLGAESLKRELGIKSRLRLYWGDAKTPFATELKSGLHSITLKVTSEALKKAHYVRAEAEAVEPSPRFSGQLGVTRYPFETDYRK